MNLSFSLIYNFIFLNGNINSKIFFSKSELEQNNIIACSLWNSRWCFSFFLSDVLFYLFFLNKSEPSNSRSMDLMWLGRGLLANPRLGTTPWVSCCCFCWLSRLPLPPPASILAGGVGHKAQKFWRPWALCSRYGLVAWCSRVGPCHGAWLEAWETYGLRGMWSPAAQKLDICVINDACPICWHISFSYMST